MYSHRQIKSIDGLSESEEYFIKTVYFLITRGEKSSIQNTHEQLHTLTLQCIYLPQSGATEQQT